MGAAATDFEQIGKEGRHFLIGANFGGESFGFNGHIGGLRLQKLGDVKGGAL